MLMNIGFYYYYTTNQRLKNYTINRVWFSPSAITEFRKKKNQKQKEEVKQHICDIVYFINRNGMIGGNTFAKMI